MGMAYMYVNWTEIEEAGMLSAQSVDWRSLPGEVATIAHLPTPPLEDLPRGTLHQSSTFHADFLFSLARPDIRIVSADNYMLHVHSNVLGRASENNFGELLTAKRNCEMRVNESAVILEIVFTSVYGIKFADTYPLETLIAAIEVFPKYGLEPNAYVLPTSSLYEAIRFQTPLAAFSVFALASRFHLEELAVAASPYLLSLRVRDITDEQANLVQPVYLFRLFRLHMSRTEQLKKMLFEKLETHSPTATCNYATHDKLCRAWMLAAACLCWEPDPAVSGTAIQSTLATLDEGIRCRTCKRIINERIKSIVIRWCDLKTTI